MSQAEVAQSRSPKKREADLLSNLPEEVRLKILESLPLKVAVRTSILSTHWRYQWAKLPQIIFDEIFFPTVIEGREEDSDLSMACSNIINHVLFYHIGPLHTFVLYLPDYYTNGSAIYQWLWVVSRKSVKEFTLIDNRGYVDKVPSVVFFFAELTHLTLRCCTISTLPPSFTGFPYLISLELLRCDLYSEELIERFISSCPQLRLLRLYFVNRGMNLAIQSPTLEHLIVEGFLCTLCLGNKTTKIKMMSLDFRSDTHLSHVFSSLPYLQSLSLGTRCFEKADHWHFSDQCNINVLVRLEIQALKLIGVPLHCPCINYFVVKLLNSSLPLQKLYFKVAQYGLCNCGIPPHMSSCNLLNFENGILQRLKYAEMVGVSGSSNELRLIEVILESAPVLEVMTIKLSLELREAEDKFKIAVKLMHYSRASRNARIIVKS